MHITHEAQIPSCVAVVLKTCERSATDGALHPRNNSAMRPTCLYEGSVSVARDLPLEEAGRASLRRRRDVCRRNDAATKAGKREMFHSCFTCGVYARGTFQYMDAAPPMAGGMGLLLLSCGVIREHCARSYVHLDHAPADIPEPWHTVRHGEGTGLSEHELFGDHDRDAL